MKKWILKALIQKMISFLPYSNRLNFWFQKNITKGVELNDEHFNDKLVHCFDHLQLLDNPDNSICLELGTGWYPIVPIGLFLSGVKKITSIDIDPLCNKERFLITINKFVEWRKTGRLENYLSNIDEKRWEILTNFSSQNSLVEITKKINLNLIVGDARRINLDNNSVDFICSNNVFEHIHVDIIEDIIIEFRRVLKLGGVMSHFIDMSDHFAHNDSTISIYNYLKFNDKTWKLIDNSVQPQNRMRICEYSKLFENLNVKYNYFNIRKGVPQNVKNISIADKYKSMSTDDIAVSHAHVKLLK